MWLKNILRRLLKHHSVTAKFNTMITSNKKNTAKHSSFSDFMNNASSAEKKKLYKTVLKQASVSQQRVIASAKELNAAN